MARRARRRGSPKMSRPLAAAHIPTYLVKRGEQLEGLLAQPQETHLLAADWVHHGR